MGQKWLAVFQGFSPLKKRLSLLVSGFLFSLCFAPFDWFFLSVPAFILFTLSLTVASSWKEGAVSAWFFGWGHYITSLYWIAESFFKQDAVPAALGPLAVLLLTAILALYWSLVGAFFVKFRRKGWWNVALFMVLVGLMEWLRATLFTGFPWNPIGLIWVDWGFGQLAALGGNGLLNYLSAFLLGLLFLLWEPSKSMKLPISFIAIIFVLAFAWGEDRIQTFSKTPPQQTGGDGAMVRLVQANISQRDKWRPDLREQHFDDYIALSTRSLEGGEGRLKPDYVIWPETGLTFPISQQPVRRDYLMTRLAGATLISGAPRYKREQGQLSAAYNSLHVIEKDGKIAATYDKAHLVPFGEYLPFRGLLSLIGLRKLTDGSIDFSTGPGPQLISIEGLPAFSPFICYEVIFPHQVVPSDGPRPSWLLNVTNDAWFGSSIGPWQHLAMARMRAIEQGLPLVRVAGTGISAKINAVGSIEEFIPINQKGTLDFPLSDLQNGSISTLYSRILPYLSFF